MRPTFAFLLLSIVSACMANSEWSQWRGSYDGDGVIGGSPLITEWSETENVIWKSPVPGRGASSPVIAGSKLFLTTADDEAGKQFLLCYDRDSGELLWQKLVFEGEFLVPSHRLNTEATPTPVTDGEIVVTLFGINEGQSLAAFDLEGERLWSTQVAEIDSRFGIGASPVLHNGKVIVLNDIRPHNFVAAYDLRTGKRIWKTERQGDRENYEQNHNYQTPRVFRLEGKDQLVTTGHGIMTSYDPDTGQVLWKTEGGARVTVGAPVTDGSLIYFSGGYPERGTFAFNAVTKEQEWTNRLATYIVSSVLHGDYLYSSNNRGELACMDAKTGEILWRNLFREEVLASPFIAGDYLYLILGNGVTKVIKPDPEQYVEISENVIPGMTHANPAIVDGRIYYRTEGMLYCLGKK